MRGSRALLLALCLPSLSACAPVILGRTATPLAVGENEVSISGGGSIVATPLTVCRDPDTEPGCPFEGWLSPDYWPKTLAFQIVSAWGSAPGSELNSTFMLYPLAGYRLGGKTRVGEGLPTFAVDYGASLYLSNVGVDVGVLASVPFEGGEVYSGVRGFGSAYWSGPPSLSAALTLGLMGKLETKKSFIEITVSTGRYNEVGPTTGVVPTGIIITPALGVYF